MLTGALAACGLAAGLAGCKARAPAVGLNVGTAATVRVAARSPKATTKQSKGAAVAPSPGQATPARASFASGKDKAGRLVAETLRPAEEAFAVRPEGRRAWPTPRMLEPAPLRTPPPRADVIRASPALPFVRIGPRDLPEGPPLTGEGMDNPPLPAGVQLKMATLPRVPSSDPEKPPPLPILSKAQPDRAPVSDPTGPASLQAALAQSVPLRATPAPFEPLNIPDPFELRQTARLQSPPPETPDTPLSLPRTPPQSLPEKGR
jgi:hypothetical protein